MTKIPWWPLGLPCFLARAQRNVYRRIIPSDADIFRLCISRQSMQHISSSPVSRISSTCARSSIAHTGGANRVMSQSLVAMIRRKWFMPTSYPTEGCAYSKSHTTLEHVHRPRWSIWLTRPLFRGMGCPRERCPLLGHQCHLIQ